MYYLKLFFYTGFLLNYKVIKNLLFIVSGFLVDSINTYFTFKPASKGTIIDERRISVFVVEIIL